MPPSKDTLNPSTAPNIDNGAAQCPAPITMAPELLNALQVRFKLTEVESQVYAVVLALGQLTEDEIRIYSGLPITKVQGVNKTLQKKQLIKPLPGVVTRYRAFTPYQELAKEVQALSKESEASEKAIQKIQEQIGGDIQTELQSTNRLLETTLENLIERQSIALNEAAMATNIALNNIAENMQKTVTAQAQISTQEFSNQSQALQNTVQEIIERGQAKLQENQSVSVEDIQSALKALQEETEEWIASITDQLLVQSEAISQQAQSHFNDAKLITQKTSESGIKTLTTEITKHKEGMAEIADETATTLVTSIERSNQEIQKTLDNFQKELKQDLSKKIQSITNQIRDTWNQRTQSLDNIIAQMDKALKGENRQRTRTMEKSLTELEATTKSTRETSKQINETLFQQLKKALETGGDQFISLQKEAETTIAQWPPTALNFSQISKIQSNLTTLVEQVKVENERIIKAASEGLGVEMRDTYLAQLLEVQALIKILIDELESNQATLIANFKSIVNQIGRRLKRRLNTVRKTTETFLSDFQSKISVQEEQRRALNKRVQKLLTQQSDIVLQALEIPETQIEQYADERITQAQESIKKAAKENISTATRAQDLIEKQIKTFNVTTKKLMNVTSTELKHEFGQLDKIVKQYSQGIEITADKLREEHAIRMQSAKTGYQKGITANQDSRDKAIIKAINNLSTQLTKREQNTTKELTAVLPEAIQDYSTAAINAYQTTMKKGKGALEANASLEAQAITKKQITTKLFKRLNSQIIKTLNEKLITSTENLEAFLAKEQTKFNKEANAAFTSAREQFVEVQNQYTNKFNSLITEQLNTEVASILRDCRTKVGRQTKRNTQIERLFVNTQNRLLQLPKDLFAKESKAVRDNLTKKLTSILQDLKSKLLTQTDRETQITKIFQSTATELQTLPEKLLPALAEQHLGQQVLDLQAAFIEYQGAIENLQKAYARAILNETKSIQTNLLELNYAKTLKPQFARILKRNTTKIIKAYQNSINNGLTELRIQASNTFHTTMDKQLRTHLSTKLREYQIFQTQPINEPVKALEATLQEITKKVDIKSRALEDKNWGQINKIIDEYSNIVGGNLNALNTAIGSIVDQVTLNVTTSLSNFEDEANNLLTTTAQSFQREKSGINEQINQGITEMQEDCLAQFQEAQSLLGTIIEDIKAQKAMLMQKLDTAGEEVDKTTTANLESIRETTNSFIENIQTELQTQEGRIENLIKSIQNLISKQSTSSTDLIASIQKQLESFNEYQIPKAQGIIEETSAACTQKIDEQHNAIDKNLETFATTLFEETDDYVTTLQQEIVQLQTVAEKLVDKIGATGSSINKGLIDTVESNRIKMASATTEQLSSFSTEVESTFQKLNEEQHVVHNQLLSKLTQIKEEEAETLTQLNTSINTTLETALNDILSKNEQIGQTHRETITAKTNNLTTQLQENLTAIGEKTTTSSNQLTQTLTTALSDSQSELNRIFSDSEKAIDEDHQKTSAEFVDSKLFLQTFHKALDLIRTRLIRAIQDDNRHTTEVMHNFKKATATSIQQKSDAVNTSIKQLIESTQESVFTQTQQTERRINQTLGKERQVLKNKGQALTKDIIAKIKAVEEATVTNVNNFSQKITPIIERLKAQADDTQQILVGLWESLMSLQPAEADRTWRIVTCAGIQNHLLDMFRRVNETITLVYPSFDEVPVTELSKVQPENRVHIITTLDGEKQRANAQKLLQQGNIRIWNNPKMEFYGGSRDGEEVLIAPTFGDQGEIVAVVSDQTSYIALFNRTLGPRWISASEEIRLRE